MVKREKKKIDNIRYHGQEGKKKMKESTYWILLLLITSYVCFEDQHIHYCLFSIISGK